MAIGCGPASLFGAKAMITKRNLLCTIAVALCGQMLAHPAIADAYPNRPVKIVVPFPAGGGADSAARLIAEHLGRALGHQFYVENKSGSGGVIGTEAAARSPADGHTLLVTSDSLASLPHVFKLGFDPMKDLVPVIQVARQPIVLAVHPSLGVSSIAELIALAKRRPGMSYASSGIASPMSMVPRWMGQIVGIRFEFVPYRGGGQAINDLVAGHVKIASLGSAPVIPHYRAGTLQILAQTSEVRSASLPDVPTYQEAGVAGLVLDQWFGVFVPAGTPPGIVARLNAEIDKVLAIASVRENLMQLAQEPIGGSTEQFSRLVREDHKKYGRLVTELDIKAP
jgi:tripartite-type tricarboxylate transporter receptor subunit TctC